jgi:feruloyl esterase
MTVKAKAIVDAFYGSAPRVVLQRLLDRGRQALTEATRHPEDFDGIIAGAAANPKTHLDTWRIWMGLETLKDPETRIPKDMYPAIHQQVLAACDARDGLKDGLISDSDHCHFDPQVMACKGTDDASCLTPKQVQSVQTILGPSRARAAGRRSSGPISRAPSSHGDCSSAGPDPYETALDQFRYMVFDDPNGIGERSTSIETWQRRIRNSRVC